MNKLLITILFIILPIAGSFAKEANYHGVLQIYWLPVWDNGVNNPKLEYRFFPESGGDSSLINLSGNVLSEETIKNENPLFFMGKNGHIEYYGDVKIKNIKKISECDMVFYNADFVSFKGVKNERVNINELERNNGCQAYPYLISFILNPNLKNEYFKEKPLADARSLGKIPHETPLVQIKKVDSKWLYVGVYDGGRHPPIGNQRGYIEIEKLKILN